MCQWSQLEGVLNQTIHRSLGLNFSQGAILSHNLQVRDKINVLRSSFALYSERRMSDQWRAEADRVFTRIMNEIVPDRNTIAHTMFLPTNAGDLELYHVKARKVLSQEMEVWTLRDVQRKCRQMNEFERAVWQLSSELFPSRRGLIEPRTPNGILDPQVPLYLPRPPRPKRRHSGARTASLEKEPRTRRKPQGKG